MAAEGTYSHQDALERLPVPDLATTVTRFLTSCKPLLSDEEMTTVTAQAKAFLATTGLGPKLQQRLLDRAAAHHDRSWLIDWWNKWSYMAWRLPVVINVSYFYAFTNETNARRKTQVGRAAALISATMSYRDLLVSETLPADKSRTGKLCMHMYRYMFNSSRVPRKDEDYTSAADHNNTRILVVRKNKFYTFDAGSGAKRLTVEEMETQLQRIIDIAGDVADPVPIGALTSAHRDDLATYHETLCNAHPVNKSTLQEIQAATFAVCLDDTSPSDEVSISRGFLHGDGQNRWYDKHLQYIVYANGVAGFMGEHSAMDGMPTATMTNWVCASIAQGKLGQPSGKPVRALPMPASHSFYVSPQTKRDVAASIAAHERAVADHELGVLSYTKYGKNQVKKFKCSPDAFAQMAIQLAYYSMFGECRPTYEPAHTRRFLRGRTETIRSVSKDSLAWVKSMRSPSATPQERFELLRKAAATHSKNSKLAGAGEGVDRHLLGLRLLREKGEASAFLDNPKVSSTWYWAISTSNLTSEYFQAWGWGEVVPDGVGIAYSTQKNAFRFNITSRTGVGAPQLCSMIGRCLDEMYEMAVAATTAQSSRL